MVVYSIAPASSSAPHLLGRVAGGPVLLLVDDRVDRHRRLAGLPVADDQLPLAPADRGQRVDRLQAGLQRLVHRLTLHHRGGLQLQCPALGGLDLTEAVDRVGQRVDHPAEEGVTDRHRQHLAGAVHLLTRLDAGELAQHHDADLPDVEVQGQPEGAVGEPEQLVGHHRGQTLDPGDAVTGLTDPADLLPGGRAGLVGLHEAVQGGPDLLRADGELRHRAACLLCLIICGPKSLGDAGSWDVRAQPASRRRTSSSRVAMLPSRTSPPTSTRIPPSTWGSTSTLRCTRLP
jgi:hypothetical protein